MNVRKKRQIGKTKKTKRTILAEPVSELNDSLHEIQTWGSQFVAPGKKSIPFHVITSTTQLNQIRIMWSMVILVVYLTAKHWTLLTILKQGSDKQTLNKLVSIKKVRAPSHVKIDETHLWISFHPEMTLFRLTCSSHPGMIWIQMNDKHLICFKNNSFIPRWVFNFYAHDNFLHFGPSMKFCPCQDSDEIIPGRNFTLAKTCEYNEYFDQRQR